jgi:hypothetical protein
VEQWTILDDDYAAGEFQPKLHGRDVKRRFVVLRERVREGRDSVGRKLIEVPGYTFRVFVTNAPQEIWRGYNRRVDMENRIAELKHDLGADGFCLKQFFATEAAFRAVLAEFQRAAGLPGHRQPATIRTLANPNFAEVGNLRRNLIQNSPNRASKSRFRRSLPVQFRFFESIKARFCTGAGLRSPPLQRTGRPAI